jgi:YHS domain-containing protein
MKRFPDSLAAAYLMAVIVLAGNSAVAGSEKQTAGPAGSTSENRPAATAEEVSQKDPKGGTQGKANVDSQGIILKGYDAVAYFKQGKPVKGNPAIASAYQGATYLFASSANKADFDKDPAKYAPKYGAFYSYGVVMGVLVDPVDPGAFAVYKGKLYVCGNQGTMKDFKSDIDANIEKADVNWRQLTVR